MFFLIFKLTYYQPIKPTSTPDGSRMCGVVGFLKDDVNIDHGNNFYDNVQIESILKQVNLMLEKNSKESLMFQNNWEDKLWIKKLIYYLFVVKEVRSPHVMDFAYSLVVSEQPNLVSFWNMKEEVFQSVSSSSKKKLKSIFSKRAGFTKQIYDVIKAKFFPIANAPTDNSGPVTNQPWHNFEFCIDKVKAKLLDQNVPNSKLRVFFQLGQRIGNLVSSKRIRFKNRSIENCGLLELSFNSFSERVAFSQCLVGQTQIGTTPKTKKVTRTNPNPEVNARLQRQIYVNIDPLGCLKCTFHRERENAPVLGGDKSKNPFIAMETLNGETSPVNFAFSDQNMGPLMYSTKYFGVVGNSDLKEILTPMHDNVNDILSKIKKLENARDVIIEARKWQFENDNNYKVDRWHTNYVSSKTIDWKSTHSIAIFAEKSSKRLKKTIQQLHFAQSRIKAKIKRVRKQAYYNLAFCISIDPTIEVFVFPELDVKGMQKGKSKRVRQLIQQLAPAEQDAAICAAMKRAGKIVLRCSEYGTTLASAIPTVEITDMANGEKFKCYEVKRIGPSKMKPVPGYSDFEIMRDLASCDALFHQLCTSKEFSDKLLSLVKGMYR